jgi:hypothetical protein
VKAFKQHNEHYTTTSVEIGGCAGQVLGSWQAWRGERYAALSAQSRHCRHVTRSFQGTFSEIYSVINTDNDTLAALKVERKTTILFAKLVNFHFSIQKHIAIP